MPSDFDLLQYVAELEGRLALLQDAAAGLSPEHRQLLTQALEEHRTSLAELETAWDELRAMNAELQELRFQLESERRRYQELFDLAPDGYLVTEANGTIREANRAAGELLSVQADLLVGKPLATYIAPEDRRAFRPYVTRLRHAERLEELWVGVRPRGRPAFHAALTAVPARDAGRQMVGIRWLLRDVSERVKHEATLRSAQEDLGKRLLEQSAELTMANTTLRREAAEREERLAVEEDQHRALVAALSAPVLQIREGLLLLPVIGAVDPGRASLLVSKLLEAVRRHRARVVVIDITGAAGVDAQGAALFARASDAARLLGAQVLLAGASPEVCKALVDSRLDLARLNPVQDLRSAIEMAEAQLARSHASA